MMIGLAQFISICNVHFLGKNRCVDVDSCSIIMNGCISMMYYRDEPVNYV